MTGMRFTAGENYTYTLTWTRPDNTTPLPLTSGTWEFRATPTGRLYLSVTGTISGDQQEKVTVSLTPALSAQIRSGVARCTVVDVDGQTSIDEVEVCVDA